MENTSQFFASEEREHIVKQLSVLLADYHIHYQNLKSYHWGVRGAGFFTLHSLFEKYYNSAASRIDEIAERILSLGAMPPHTYEDYMDSTRLIVRGATECSWEMIKNLKTDIESLLALSRSIICAATQAHDDVTVDMLVGYNAEDEKKLWMISAYIDAEHQHKC